MQQPFVLEFDTKFVVKNSQHRFQVRFREEFFTVQNKLLQKLLKNALENFLKKFIEIYLTHFFPKNYVKSRQYFCESTYIIYDILSTRKKLKIVLNYSFSDSIQNFHNSTDKNFLFDPN